MQAYEIWVADKMLGRFFTMGVALDFAETTPGRYMSGAMIRTVEGEQDSKTGLLTVSKIISELKCSDL